MRNAMLLDLVWLFADGGAAGASAPGAGTSPAGGPAPRTSDQIAAEAGIKMPGSDRRAKQTQNAGGKTLYGRQEGNAAILARRAAVEQASGKAPSGNRLGQAVSRGKESQEGAAPDAGEQAAENSAQARAKAFRALIEGEYKQEYKDLFTQESQRVINARFKETRQLEESVNAQKPLLDVLMQRYGITDGDVSKLQHAVEGDRVYLSAAAEKAGMDTDAFQEAARLQQEKAALEQTKKDHFRQQAQTAQYDAWLREAGELRKSYSGFDLRTECRSDQFVKLLKARVPMQAAFEAVHADDLKRVAVQSAREKTEQAVVEHIRAKGVRPAENGVAAQSGVSVKSDVHALTRDDRANIARRVAGGEKIAF